MTVANLARPFALRRIYLKRVPASNNVPDRFDVEAYQDRKHCRPLARWAWPDARRPAKGQSYVTLNAERMRAYWFG
ncbi:hypothetical protein [Caulobacter sp. 17J65-9]|uniref:hypothetical protein n=1 Tax=Caulobacter sp. 17J65-9 TaxID=2709382 RepID=UPI0013C8B2C3|nr:hypothetical protein [Caulobacter sp. 17J65-9]NEX91164.1 hypothetical protein [Caulobacter sp. 17J65-9]